MSEGKIVDENHVYVQPTREVIDPMDIEKWKKSEAYLEYKGFLCSLNDSVKRKAISSEYPASASIGIAIDILDHVDKWIDDFPPIQQQQRFGNLAFRSLYDKLQKEAEDLLKKKLPSNFHKAIVELLPYFVDCFGNSTRIDYGTGHEMSFLWLLSCLFKIGFFELNDKCAVVLKVFERYIRLARKLQTTYRMEPAGSRGVWSLDDYQFVPFLWGSAQLIDHDRIEPKSFTEPEVVERFHNDYIFLSCIQYINSVKSGPFFEHSNQLFHVSGVATWEKVNRGLQRMYDDQVLNKFPVVQHLVFGSLMSIKPAKPQTAASRGPPRCDPSKLPPPKPL